MARKAKPLVLDPALQITVDWLEEQPQDMWLAFVENTNYDFAVDALRWMVRSGKCDRAVALAMYWNLAAGYYVQYAARSEVPAHAQLTYNLVKKIERMFLAGEFAESDLGYDPTGRLGDYADVPVVTPIPEELKRPIPGRQIDVFALTQCWINGLHAFVYDELDACEQGSAEA